MWRATIIAAAGATLVACAAVSAGSVSGEDTEIFYASSVEADADLARFEAHHPQCDLWSNWQKTCSRSGERGGVECATEKSRPVRPSKPFCVSWARGADASLKAESSAAASSRSRFCNAEPVEIQGSTTSAFCASPDPERPFSGRDLSARRHRYCRVWAEEHTGTPICAEGAEFPELPRCATLATAGYRSRQPLYCATDDDRAIESCSEPRGMTGRRRGIARPSYLDMANADQENIIAVSDSEDFILASYCEGD